MRIKRIIGELCIFKNRASSSKNEHRAAQHIYQFMRSLGLVTSIDTFKSQKQMTWELMTITGFFLAQAIAYFFYPTWSVICGVSGLVLFWGYFTTRFKPLSPLFRFSRSNNVVGKLLNTDAPFKIILTAHYDTARSGPMWNPKNVSKFRFNFLMGVCVIFILLILSILNLTSVHIFF